MNDGKVREEIVLQTAGQGLVRDSHVVPTLVRIQLREIEAAEEFGREQRAAETAMLIRGSDTLGQALGVEVGIVDLARFVHRYSGCNAAIGTLADTVEEGLQGVGL